VDIPCGEGPPIMVDGRPVQTALTGTVGDLMTLGSLALRVCDPPAALGKGEHRIQTVDEGAFSVDSLTLGQPASSGDTDPGRRVRVQRWGAAARSLDVDPGPRALLATNENFNAGWEARLESRRLAPTQLDGWRQGWVVPAGPGGHVVLTFRPDRLYRGGLLAGSAAVLLVVVLAFSRPRRPKVLNACQPGAIPAGAAVVAAAATAFLCGGWAVLIVLPPLLLFRSRVAVLAGASAVLATGIAAGQHAYGPTSGVGAFGRPAQLLTIVAVAGTVMALSSRGNPDAEG
jgi:arabinofuranan 3-O-arabinosyltransferase